MPYKNSMKRIVVYMEPVAHNKLRKKLFNRNKTVSEWFREMAEKELLNPVVEELKVALKKAAAEFVNPQAVMDVAVPPMHIPKEVENPGDGKEKGLNQSEVAKRILAKAKAEPRQCAATPMCREEAIHGKMKNGVVSYYCEIHA